MNFLVQPMPPSTDYMLPFPGFNETWCDLTSYKVPNVMISELCCSCQKERHGFSSGPPSILLSINFSYFFIHKYIFHLYMCVCMCLLGCMCMLGCSVFWGENEVIMRKVRCLKCLGVSLLVLVAQQPTLPTETVNPTSLV